MTARTLADDLPPILTPKQVADLFGVPIGTVRSWRLNHTKYLRGNTDVAECGPEGFRVGRHVRYRREAVLAYIAAQEAAEEKRAS